MGTWAHGKYRTVFVLMTWEGVVRDSPDYSREPMYGVLGCMYSAGRMYYGTDSVCMYYTVCAACTGIIGQSYGLLCSLRSRYRVLRPRSNLPSLFLPMNDGILTVNSFRGKMYGVQDTESDRHDRYHSRTLLFGYLSRGSFAREAFAREDLPWNFIQDFIH